MGRRSQRPPRPTLMKSTASAREPSSSQCSATRICRYCGVPLHPYILQSPGFPVAGGHSGRPQKTKSHRAAKAVLCPCRPRPLRRLVPRGAGGEVSNNPQADTGERGRYQKKVTRRRRNRRRKNLMVA